MAEARALGKGSPIRRVALLGALLAFTGCVLTTRFGDLVGGATKATDADASASRFSIGGTVTGLEGATVTLALNVMDALTVSRDGSFAFESRLSQGASYVVTVLRTSDNRVCTVGQGEGFVESADVTSLSVVCPSGNALLSNLALSSGAVSPAFRPDITKYSGAQVGKSVFSWRDLITTITPTTESPTATLTVNEAPATSGQPVALSSLLHGANAVTVVVRAADGRTTKTYGLDLALSLDAQEAYIKASNTHEGHLFGQSTALSADGSTLAVGAPLESSASPGINGVESDRSLAAAGAVYVFRRSGTTWTQEAYVKASQPRTASGFGVSVALSADGNTLAVGADGESSAATGINGNQSDTSASGAGAAYVFRRAGTTWTQDAYVKASNTHFTDQFGAALALSADGTVLVVGAPRENSAGVGINGDQTSGTEYGAGSVYVFMRSTSTWAQQAYIKASNTRSNANFGASLALSADATTLAVGSPTEVSAAVGINGDQTDASTIAAGAAYVFRRSAMTWAQEAYVKASNTGRFAELGSSLSLSGDGSTLAVGARGERSAGSGINPPQNDGETTQEAGAAYVFKRSGASTWAQEVFIKASKTRAQALFGTSVALSSNGQRLVIGSQDANGLVYAFTASAKTWVEQTSFVASNPRPKAEFGGHVALSGDGNVAVVSAAAESSAATGVNGAQSDQSALRAGAVYVFR